MKLLQKIFTSNIYLTKRAARRWMVRSASIYIWSGHKQPRCGTGRPGWRNALLSLTTPAGLQRRQCICFSSQWTWNAPCREVTGWQPAMWRIIRLEPTRLPPKSYWGALINRSSKRPPGTGWTDFAGVSKDTRVFFLTTTELHYASRLHLHGILIGSR